jgi:hypothetical protein
MAAMRWFSSKGYCPIGSISALFFLVAAFTLSFSVFAQTPICAYQVSTNGGNTIVTNGGAVTPGSFLFVGSFGTGLSSGRDILIDGSPAVRIFGWPNGVSTTGLSLGSHTLRATHPVDLGDSCAGQFTEITFVLTNDAIPPVISDPNISSSPLVNGYTLGSFSSDLRVTASDTQTPTAQMTVRARFGSNPWFSLQYESFSEFGNNQWRVSLGTVQLANLQNGTYDLVIEARDTSNNASSITRSVVVNLPVPLTPTIALPSQNQVVRTRNALVTGSAQDAAQVRIVSSDTLIESTIAVNNGGYSGTITFPQDGTYTITATGTNANRTSPASAARTFTIDSVGPQPILWQFDDGATLTAGSTVTRKGQIQVTLQDASAIVGSSVSLLLEGVAVDNASWSAGAQTLFATVDFDAVSNGARILALSATDEHGNLATTELSVNVEVAPLQSPVLSDPPASAYVRFPDVNVIGTSRENTIVTLLLGGVATGAPMAVASGNFSKIVTLPADGVYQIQAVAETSREFSPPSPARTVTLDRVAPLITLVEYAGAPLTAGTVVTTTGLLRVTATDVVALASLRIVIQGVLNEAGVNGVANLPVNFANAANGNYELVVTARDLANNATESRIPFVLNLAPPATPPTITYPTNGLALTSPNVPVSGTAPIGTQVQLYLGGVALGGLIAVTANGTFSGYLTGLLEGANLITADARNIRGSSPRSAPVSVNLSVAAPAVSFASPSAGATLTATTNIELTATASAPRTVSRVVLSINGAPVATLTSPPYRFIWNLDAVPNGPHTFAAVVTDSTGATGSRTQTITLNKPPPPVITPYIGRVDAVTPAQSFGATTVAVEGRALGRFDNATVGGAPLLLKLKNNGYVRTLNVVTNANGAFVFNFIPQIGDQGSYDVSLIHPDENTPPVVQGTFAVNRLTVDNSRIRLRAPRGFTERFTVNLTTSPGTTASSVSLATPASAQPGGTLPTGISATAVPTTVAAGSGAVPYQISFTSTAQSPNTGVLVAQLVATESGAAPRAEIRIDFELVNAEPAIVPTPSALALGAKRGQAVSERIVLDNKGLVAAAGVTATLLALNDAAPPAWVFLSTTSAIGALAAGASVPVQINAAPDVGVDDGIYQFKLRVRRDVAGAPTLVGDLPISVAVTSSDNGRALFETANIYTNTRDVNNALILGVENVRISLQNEAVPTQNFTVTTNAQGIAQSDPIPAGRYRWRASALNHKDASGIVVIRPGGNTQQKIFLEYTVVSFNFSVTETTIQDQYDVIITATFQTQVPAPVVIIEPSAINVPPMQVGEQISGEMTITNYGLVRADNVVFTPPPSNQYWRIEIGGTVPNSLDAKARIVLPYKLTLLSALSSGAARQSLALQSGASGPSLIARAMANGMTARFDGNRAVSGLKRVDQKSGGTCSSTQSAGQLAYEFTCANGDKSSGGGGVAFASTTGSSCGGGAGSGGGGGGGGGWAWGDVNLGGTDAPMSPGCTPDCPAGTCCNGNGAAN